MSVQHNSLGAYYSFPLQQFVRESLLIQGTRAALLVWEVRRKWQQ